MQDRYDKYQKELAPLIESDRNDPVGVWNASHIDAALHALVESDRYADMLNRTPRAMLGRYEMRDGAAMVIASVWGLDMDYARRVMQTHQAWADYMETMKECPEMNEYEIRKVVSEYRTEHSGWVYAPNEEKALEIARDYQGEDVIVRRRK